jgi:outer membrane protein OmpA-like peptidoglycan-associated protein
MEFFKANGIAESQITVRFHGERYPWCRTTMRPTGRRIAGSA